MITFFEGFPFNFLANTFTLEPSELICSANRYTRFHMKAKVMASKLKKNPSRKVIIFFFETYLLTLKTFGWQKFSRFQPKKLGNFAKFNLIIQTEDVKITEFNFAIYYRYNLMEFNFKFCDALC